MQRHGALFSGLLLADACLSEQLLLLVYAYMGSATLPSNSRLSLDETGETLLAPPMSM